jgi:hypothetical protein
MLQLHQCMLGLGWYLFASVLGIWLFVQDAQRNTVPDTSHAVTLQVTLAFGLLGVPLCSPHWVACPHWIACPQKRTAEQHKFISTDHNTINLLG